MINTYWEKALSFELYLDTLEEKSKSKDDKTDKYLHSLKKANHIMSNYIPDDHQEKELNAKKFKGKILIIAEGWCGDCSQSLPVVNKFFSGKNAVKIVSRNENPDLMNRFLTNGNEAIPIVIFLDQKNNLINTWGPRTKFGTELFLKYKKDPENYSRETFLSDLQNYYNSNKGHDIINEIISLLP